MRYKNKEITHGLFTVNIPLETFLVTARTKGCSRSFIVIATDHNDAIARLTCNAKNTIAAIKASLSPADLLPTKEHVHNEANMKRALELSEITSRMNDKLIELEDTTDELTEVRKEGLREDIQSNYALIKELRATKEVEVPPKADQMTERLRELIDGSMKLTAEKLNPDRVYSVAYFDDERDYCSHP